MSLKFRYASALLGVFICLCGAVWLALTLLTEKEYWWLALLAILLYGGMFFCGRKMAKVFYLLSMLKYLRKQGGSATIGECKKFLSGALPKKSAEEISVVLDEVVSQLVEGDLVTTAGETIILTSV